MKSGQNPEDAGNRGCGKDGNSRRWRKGWDLCRCWRKLRRWMGRQLREIFAGWSEEQKRVCYMRVRKRRESMDKNGADL